MDLLSQFDAEASLRGWGDHTQSAYRRIWRRLVAWSESRGIHPKEISLPLAREFMLEVFPSAKPATQMQIHAGITGLYQMLRIENPFKELPRPPVRASDRQISYLNRADILKLMSTLEEDKNTYGGACSYILAYTLFSTGQRFTSIATLQWEEVLEDKIRIRGKRDKHRDIPLNSTTKALLKWWKELQSSWKGAIRLAGKNARAFVRCSYVFPSAWAKPITNYGFNLRLQAACRKAGLRVISAHDLRHSAATDLLQRGESLVRIKELLGHESIATTNIYTHVAPEELRASVESLNL